MQWHLHLENHRQPEDGIQAGLGFRVQGLGFRVQGVLGVRGLRFRVLASSRGLRGGLCQGIQLQYQSKETILATNLL